MFYNCNHKRKVMATKLKNQYKADCPLPKRVELRIFCHRCSYKAKQVIVLVTNRCHTLVNDFTSDKWRFKVCFSFDAQIYLKELDEKIWNCFTYYSITYFLFYCLCCYKRSCHLFVLLKPQSNSLLIVITITTLLNLYCRGYCH